MVKIAFAYASMQMHNYPKPSHNTYNQDKNLQKNCNLYSDVKVCLQPGLEAQKVEKHWCRGLPSGLSSFINYVYLGMS